MGKAYGLKQDRSVTRKFVLLMSALLIAVSISGCSAAQQENSQTDQPVETTVTAESAERSNAEESEENPDMENMTPITLTIGDEVLDAYLNDSVPAKSFMEQLPVTISMTAWSMGTEKDYCGSRIDVEYSKSDVQTGFKNGDIVFYVEHGANEFVIFVSGEEDCEKFKGNVVMGRLTEESLAWFQNAGRSLTAIVALAE